MAGAFPNQRLVRPGHHLDRLGLHSVPGHRAQLVGIGAHHVGQRVRVGGAAFGAGHAVPFPVAGHLQWVDRIHRVPGGNQRLYPRSSVGLDPDRHLGLVDVLTEVLGDHRMQSSHPRYPLRQPGLGQPPPRGVHQLNVVMRLGPVVSHEQQRIPLFVVDPAQPAGEPSAT